MREREEYHRRLAEEESDGEEANLDVIEDAVEDQVPELSIDKGKGVERPNAEPTEDVREIPRKKRPRPMDPFGCELYYA